jgi:hypothetical protein
MRAFTILFMAFSIFLAAGCDGGSDDDDNDAADDDDSDDGFTAQGGTHVDKARGITLTAYCEITVPRPSDKDPYGEGWHEFTLETGTEADIVWIEMWSLDSSYCEGYDTATGDPCTSTAGDRPGWDLDLVGSTADPPYEQWFLSLDYDGTWSPAEDVSTFLCEGAGSEYATYFCWCSADNPSSCWCIEFPSTAWQPVE